MKGILNKRYIKGFTLVELIIVITILGILATIAFISFQGYSKNARDGNRITTLKNIGKGLEVYKVQTGNYPQPDDSINIEASGTVIGYQGNVGDSISRLIKMNVTPTDPSDKEKYLYSISGDKKKYQVLGYLETTEYLSLLPQSYAVDYSNRYIKTEGDKVGIVLDANKNPLSGVTKVDVATGSTVYNVYFGYKDVVNGSGSTILSNITTRREDLSSNTSLASLDTTLIGYWDMETLSGGKLRDFSRYGNDGTLNGGIIVGGVDGKNGMAVYFTGSQYISMNSSIKKSSTYSICSWLKNIDGGVYPYYIESTDLAGTQQYLSLQIRFSKNTLYVVDNVGWKSTSSSYNISLNDWHFVCISNNNMNVSFYLDGLYMSNGSIPVEDVVTSYGNIGKGFIGYIDDLKIYSRALSDSEVQELYNSTK